MKATRYFNFSPGKTPADMGDAGAVTANAAKIKVAYSNKILYNADVMTKIVTSALIYRRRNRR